MKTYTARSLAIKITILLTVILSAVLLAVPVSAQTPASISLAADSTNAAEDSQSVTVKIASGDSRITAAQACVSYDKTQLEFVTIDYSGGALSSATPSDPSGDCAKDDVQLSRYDITNHPSGSFSLGTIVFKSITTRATTTLNINKARSFVYDDTSSGLNILGDVSGTSLTLTRNEGQRPSSTLQRVMLVLLLALLCFAVFSVFRKRDKAKEKSADTSKPTN